MYHHWQWCVLPEAATCGRVECRAAGEEHPGATLGQAGKYAPHSTLMRAPGGAHHRQMWCAPSGPPPCYPTTLDAYQSVPAEGGKPIRRGDEMSRSPTTSAATPDVVEDTEPTLVKDGVSHAPVFITEQEVVFSTAAAISSRPASISGRLIDAIRGAGARLHQPPARRHYPPCSSYLEHSRMSREMDRL
jgi:hypothetical protein